MFVYQSPHSANNYTLKSVMAASQLLTTETILWTENMNYMLCA